MPSSNRVTRSANGTSRTVNSSSSQPKPRPKTKRPPASSCTVQAERATASGWRSGRTKMPVASSIRSVTAAAAPSCTSGSTSSVSGLTIGPVWCCSPGCAFVGCSVRVADRQHDVLAEPQRREPGLVGGGGEVEELAWRDVVGGEADLHGTLPVRR